MSEENVTVESTQEAVVEETKTEQVEVKQEEVKAEAKSEKTFTRAQLSEIMKAEKAKWTEEFEAEKTQAEKLATMNAEEKLQFERDQYKKELEELKSIKTKNEMTSTARSIVQEAGVSISEDLLDMLVSETAEETRARVGGYIESFKAEVEKATKEALRGTTPKQPVKPAGLTKEQILAVKDRSERLKLIAKHNDLF